MEIFKKKIWFAKNLRGHWALPWEEGSQREVTTTLDQDRRPVRWKDVRVRSNEAWEWDAQQPLREGNPDHWWWWEYNHQLNTVQAVAAYESGWLQELSILSWSKAIFHREGGK